MTVASMHSKRVDGKFLGPGGVVPASQAICSSFLEGCFEISQEIKAQEESKRVATSLKPIYDRLSQLRAELDNLVLTHRWSLRETDLWNYSLSLQEIDKMRIDGKFVDSEGNRPPGQYVSSFPFHDGETRLCYRLGVAVPPAAMLRAHIPSAVVKRASFRRAYANCILSHNPNLTFVLMPAFTRFFFFYRLTNYQP